MTDKFQKNIQDWVSIDNKIKNLQQQVKEFRDQKSELTNDIFTYTESNNLENAVIKISDGKLKFHNCKNNSPLTFKLLNQCLNDLIPDEDKVDNIISYIKSKRETKYYYDIKRSYS